MSKSCYCGSEKSFSDCCEPFILKDKSAPTAEMLMRSRYTAYSTQNADYLLSTTHILKRKFHSKEAILNWSKENKWIKLEIINSSNEVIEFKAFYIDIDLKAQIHHEKSSFKLKDGKWYYVDGQFY